MAKLHGADCVELHTGKFCNLLNSNKNSKTSLNNIRKASNYAKKIGLEIHAGHGLTYQSAFIVSRIKSISEFNIGHFIIGESLFIGLEKTIKRIKKIINK